MGVSVTVVEKIALSFSRWITLFPFDRMGGRVKVQPAPGSITCLRRTIFPPDFVLSASTVTALSGSLTTVRTKNQENGQDLLLESDTTGKLQCYELLEHPALD